jgi:hypothetical protein
MSRGLLRSHSESVVLKYNKILPKGCVFSFLARMDRRGKMGNKLRKTNSPLYLPQRSQRKDVFICPNVIGTNGIRQSCGC